MQAIKIFDAFAQRVTLTVEGRDSFPTYFGVLWTLCSFIASNYLLFNTYSSYFLQNNPTIFTEKRVNDKFYVPIRNNHEETVTFEAERLYPNLLKMNRLHFAECPKALITSLSNDSITELNYENLELKSPNTTCLMPSIVKIGMAEYIEANSSLAYIPFSREILQNMNDDLGGTFSNPKLITLIDVNTYQTVIKGDDLSNLLTREKRRFRIPVDQDLTSLYSIKISRESYSISGSAFLNSMNQKSRNYYSILRVDPLGKLKKTDAFPQIGFLIEYDSTYILTTVKYLDESDLISSIGGTFGLTLLFGGLLNSILSGCLYEAYLINNYFNLYSYKDQKGLENIKLAAARPERYVESQELVKLTKDLRFANQNKKFIKLSALNVMQLSLSGVFSCCFRPSKILKIGKVISQITGNYTDFLEITKQRIIVDRLIKLLLGNSCSSNILKNIDINVDIGNLDLPNLKDSDIHNEVEDIMLLSNASIDVKKRFIHMISTSYV